jgi:protein-L-isoaspartate(D-aspartate) O-methyltransferase
VTRPRRGAKIERVGEELAGTLARMGICDPRVLAAIAAVPRALFVPEELRSHAEEDRPLPIGWGQTISQPDIVAFMTEGLRLAGGERVLEVGTGSGYQTAVLAHLAREVFSIEIVPALAERARATLIDALGFDNVFLRVGDGALGWPEAAPFDRILVTAAAPDVPPELVAQLAPGGRMIVPVGGQEEVQMLRVFEKGDDGVSFERDVLSVRFVPLTRGAP